MRRLRLYRRRIAGARQVTLDDLRSLATNTRNGFSCWPAPYQMSPTLEDVEFLYALVRVTKPRVVLELGSGRGISGRFLAEALAANEKGCLITYEPDTDHALAAHKMLSDLPAAVLHTRDEFEYLTDPDLVFIDSDYSRRTDDIAKWLDGTYAGLVCVHDANRDYPGLKAGVGVFLPGSDGLWLGRAA